MYINDLTVFPSFELTEFLDQNQKNISEYNHKFFGQFQFAVSKQERVKV